MAEFLRHALVSEVVDEKHCGFSDPRWPLVNFDTVKVIEGDLDVSGDVETEL